MSSTLAINFQVVGSESPNEHETDIVVQNHNLTQKWPLNAGVSGSQQWITYYRIIILASTLQVLKTAPESTKNRCYRPSYSYFIVFVPIVHNYPELDSLGYKSVTDSKGLSSFKFGLWSWTKNTCRMQTGHSIQGNRFR